MCVVLFTYGSFHSMDTTYRNSRNHDSSQSTGHDTDCNSNHCNNDDAYDGSSDHDQDNMDT